MKTMADSLGMVPIEAEKHEIATTDDNDAAERQNREDLDTVLGYTISAMQETFTKAPDWKPSDQNRAREVGAALAKTAIDAIGKKQEIINKSREVRSGQKGIDQKIGPGSTINNIFTDRSTLMRLMREGGMAETLTDIFAPGEPDDKS